MSPTDESPSSPSPSPSPSSSSGIWIGIDLGTSNSACAVWDSTRGGPKWMRLVDITEREASNHSKWGRLVPSVVKISKEHNKDNKNTDTAKTEESYLVGAAALKVSTGTLLSSVKRLLGRKLSDLDPHWIASLPYRVTESQDGELLLEVRVYDNDNDDGGDGGEIRSITPVQALGMILKGIRDSAQIYLDKYSTRKKLDVPGGGAAGPADIVGGPKIRTKPTIRNAVIGIPAHFSKRHVSLLEEAARWAGLDGTLNTCLESTAAAMAYGLTLQETSNDANIMVIDMGGGTTDITIATKKKDQKKMNDHTSTSTGDDSFHRTPFSTAYQVLVTAGEERLGGDDIDQAMMDICLEHSQSGKSKKESSSTSAAFQPSLLHACRKAKERLCDLESPSDSETIWIDRDEGQGIHIELIDQAKFVQILEPWLDQARALIRRAVDQFCQVSETPISEVILVGGTTRIPAIRQMIQKDIFPNLELGTSLNPMSSVAQGLAIQAALVSGLVPLHQLRSALMLDCIPHSIGVLMGPMDGTGHYIEILKRNATLPARGSATFTLADKYQPGVTITAVERIEQSQTEEPIFEPMAKEPFTFLLCRLGKEQYQQCKERVVEVGMKLDQDGQFTVSIFDEMDPEHVRKRERFKKIKALDESVDLDGSADTSGELIYLSGLVLSEAGYSTDQMFLVGTLIGIIVVYVGVKIAFNEQLLQMATE